MQSFTFFLCSLYPFLADRWHLISRRIRDEASGSSQRETPRKPLPLPTDDELAAEKLLRSPPPPPLSGAFAARDPPGAAAAAASRGAYSRRRRQGDAVLPPPRVAPPPSATPLSLSLSLSSRETLAGVEVWGSLK